MRAPLLEIAVMFLMMNQTIATEIDPNIEAEIYDKMEEILCPISTRSLSERVDELLSQLILTIAKGSAGETSFLGQYVEAQKVILGKLIGAGSIYSKSQVITIEKGLQSLKGKGQHKRRCVGTFLSYAKNSATEEQKKLYPAVLARRIISIIEKNTESSPPVLIVNPYEHPVIDQLNSILLNEKRTHGLGALLDSPEASSGENSLGTQSRSLIRGTSVSPIRSTGYSRLSDKIRGIWNNKTNFGKLGSLASWIIDHVIQQLTLEPLASENLVGLLQYIEYKPIPSDERLIKSQSSFSRIQEAANYPLIEEMIRLIDPSYDEILEKSQGVRRVSIQNIGAQQGVPATSELGPEIPTQGSSSSQKDSQMSEQKLSDTPESNSGIYMIRDHFV